MIRSSSSSRSQVMTVRWSTEMGSCGLSTLDCSYFDVKQNRKLLLEVDRTLSAN